MRLFMAAGLAAALPPLSLGGCAQFGQFTAQDATQAASVATTTGDTAVVPCWQGLAAVGNAAAAATKTGVLTGIEEKRAAKLALENPACAPLYAGVLAELLKATPAAPLVP